MPKDKRKQKYLSAYIPELKPAETSLRGKVTNGNDLDTLKKNIEELQDQQAKNNRDQLDALNNIGTNNLSAAFRRSLNGDFVKTNALIQTWADAQSAGFESIANWQSEIEVIMQTINNELGSFVKATELDAKIYSYIDGNEGKAQIISAASGAFALKDDLNNYVQASTLDASIGQYINGEAGQASVVSAVSGKFLTVDALNGYATTSDVSSIVTQSVTDGIASLSLNVTNGSETSSIALMNGDTVLSAKTISLSGFVSFTDLSTAGSTNINGANIMTGTLTADMINVNDLRVKNVWFLEDQYPYTILTSSLSNNNSTINIGITSDNGWAQGLYLNGNVICLRQPGKTGVPPLCFDMAENVVRFTGGWVIGSADYYTNAILGEVYLNTRHGLTDLYSDGTDLFFEDASGKVHTLT